MFDSTGGAIAGAKVTIIDVARGTTRSLTTDEAGKYVAPSLTTGTYTVRAEANGFRTMERNNVLVEVGPKYSRRSYAVRPASKRRPSRLRKKSRQSIPPPPPWAEPSATSRFSRCR